MDTRVETELDQSSVMRRNANAQWDAGRRQFLKNATAAGIGLMLMPTDAQASGNQSLVGTLPNGEKAWSWSYFDRTTAAPGDFVRIHVSSNAPRVRVDFYFGYAHKQAETFLSPPATSLNYTNGPANKDADGKTHPEQDWQWPGFAFQIPITWPRGVHIAIVRPVSEDGATEYALNHDTTTVLIVNPRPSETQNKILYKLSLATYNAYNTTGGLNMYNLNPLPPVVRTVDLGGNPVSGYQVTMRRPGMGGRSFLEYDHRMIAWLHRHGYAVDFCSDFDIHDASFPLSTYNLLLSVGHDEYWSQGMRSNVETFIENGGNVAFFSGNTCFWRIHFTQPDTITGAPTAFLCDKGEYQVTGKASSDVWWSVSPENLLTGVSSRNGGQWWGNALRPTLGYHVQNAHHWLFSGIRLNEGQVVGGPPFMRGSHPLVGYECDGAQFEYDRAGIAAPTGADGTPKNFEILGVAELTPAEYFAPSSVTSKHSTWKVIAREDSIGTGLATQIRGRYAATMGVYYRNGTVFSGGTTDWPQALVAEAATQRPIRRITRNVLDRLAVRRVRKVVGMPDLDGDGRPDILFQDQTSGELNYWNLDGVSVVSAGHLGIEPLPAPWKVASVVDMDNDGKADIVYHNPSTGSLAYRLMNGLIPGRSGLFQGGPIPTRWRVAAMADLNDDGSPDIVLQERSSDQLGYLLLKRLNQGASGLLMPSDLPAGYRVVTAIDPDANGEVTIVLQDAATGNIVLWSLEDLNRTAIFTPTPVGPGPEWELIAAADLNADGVKDFVFQHRRTNQLAYWLLNAKYIRQVNGYFTPSYC